METYKSIGVAAGSLMLPWALTDQHLQLSDQPVSVFINLEGVFRNLSLNENLNSLIATHKRNVVLDLESSILNLVANYRAYFMRKQCVPTIYLYYTSLEETNQQMHVYNKYYRCYYRNKYMQNPSFKQMGLLLKDTILPEVKLILSYVKDCHLIEANTFDSSIVPLILATDTNVIFSSDIFDTLYMFNPSFKMMYIKRRYSNLKVYSDIDSVVQHTIKNENPFDLTLFHSEMYYRLLLSIKGSKVRNINSAKGYGYGKCMRLLKEGMDKDIILKDFQSIDSVIELFPEKYRNDIKMAFNCYDLETQYNLLSNADKENIKLQITNNVDMESLNLMNNRFLDFPINLPSLISVL